jgi:RHS repeat-associated protein
LIRAFLRVNFQSIFVRSWFAFAFQASASLLWTPRGQVSSITYPSGRVVTTTYDVAGRISGVNGSLNGTSTPYVSGTSYAAHGGLAGMSMGDGLSRSFTYNQRLQTTQVSAGSLMTLGLNWGSVQNNGTLQQQTITRPGLGVTQTYGYDGVSRLNSASEPGNFSQSYVYDNVGNRAVTGNSSLVLPNYTPQTSLSSPPPPGSSANWPFDPATNHWAAPAASYDLAGNTTGLRTQSMGYDAESRMTSWSDSSISPATTVLFSYDGDGRRVMKTGGTSGTTTYVYDPAGNLALEAGGVAAVAATSYLTADHLGSTRLVTNGSGGCVGAHDFLPFGEAIPGTWGRGAVPCYPAMDTQTDTTWKFGGQERDTETGFDNFLARHMAGPQGRFLSVDPGSAGGVSGDPQSWNGYAYAGNSPLVNIDPSGECTVVNGQYVPDSGNPCPASTGTSITVIEAGPDDLLLLAVKLFAASLEVLQKTQELAAPLVNIVNDFRHSSSCTDSLVGIGQVAGGAALGGYSAVAGFAAGGFLGSPSGPGAAATAVGGAALFGGLGTMAGARAGGGIGGVAAGIFCSKGTSTGGDEYRDKTRGANSRDAKIIRDVAREAGVNAREFGDYVEDMKPGYGHGPSDNFSYKQLLDLADQYKRAGGK